MSDDAATLTKINEALDRMADTLHEELTDLKNHLWTLGHRVHALEARHSAASVSLSPDGSDGMEAWPDRPLLRPRPRWLRIFRWGGQTQP
jgi:hypothetical protein